MGWRGSAALGAALAAVAGGAFLFLPEIGTGRSLRVLLVGIDGADWEILDPLLEKGELPNLARLIERGVSGPLRSIEPLISPPIWTSIATGVKPERHGITWFLSDTEDPARRVPVTSTLRRVKALWNVLSEAGRRVGVVGWWATYPAERVRGFVVSDFVGFHGFGNTGRTVQSEIGKAYPPTLLDAIRALLADPQSLSYETARRFLDLDEAEFEEARRGEGRWGQAVRLFCTYLATAGSYVRIAQAASAKARPEVLLVYFELPDAASHLFARYASPRMPGISEEGHARFARVVEETYRYQDELLGRLLSLGDRRTAVFVVSDHGFRWRERRPEEGEQVRIGEAHLWHEEEGILVAAGAGIRRGERIAKASVLDVLPTLLRYLGLPIARDMDGTALVDLFEPAWLDANPPSVIDTYEAAEEDAARRPRRLSGDAVEFGEEQEERLAALGYLSRKGGSSEVLANRVRLLLRDGKLEAVEEEVRELIRRSPADVSLRILLADVYRRTYRTLLARREYEAALSSAPSDPVALCGLGEVVLEEGDLQAAEAWFRIAIDATGGFERSHVGLGHVLNLQGRPIEAKEEFLRALELAPRSYQALFDLGVLAHRAGELDEAETRYREAVAAEPNDPRARMNLGVLLCDRGRFREGIEALVEAVRIAPEDAEVRYNLGVTYLERGMAESAVEQLEASARSNPDLRGARLALGDAYVRVGRVEEALLSFETASRMDPRDPEAPYAQALLEAALGRNERARGALGRAMAVGGEEVRRRAREDGRLASVLADRPEEASGPASVNATKASGRR
jgi:Flp pilus assembly protein TadD